MHFQPPYWRTIEFFAAQRHGRVKVVFPEFTRRGHRVLGLVAAGRRSAGCRGDLVLSLRPVRYHGCSIFTKLRVACRVRGIVRASGAGFGG